MLNKLGIAFIAFLVAVMIVPFQASAATTTKYYVDLGSEVPMKYLRLSNKNVYSFTVYNADGELVKKVGFATDPEPLADNTLWVLGGSNLNTVNVRYILIESTNLPTGVQHSISNLIAEYVTITKAFTTTNPIPPPDTTPPAEVTNLLPSSVYETRAVLSFRTPSTSDFDKYRVYKNGSPVFTSQAGRGKNTNYTYDTMNSLAKNTTYTYKVTTLDLKGNESSGVSIDVTTLSGDIQPPPIPTNLEAEPSNGKVNLTWSAVNADDLDGYNIYVNNVKINSSPVTNTNYEAAVINNETHIIQVTSIDLLGNESGRSAPVSSYWDTISPLAPIGLTSNPSGNGTTTLQWTANTEPDLAGYNVYQDSIKKNESIIVPNEYTVNGLNQNQEYKFSVTAIDTSSNESPQSAAVTYFMDGAAPLAPSGLSGTASSDRVTLTWLAPIDEDLAYYNIYQDGVRIESNVTETNFVAKGLQPDVLYNFTVRAVDDSGNESPNSNPLTIRTESAPTTIPKNVKAQATNEKVTLTWDAITNATAYNIYKNDKKIGTTEKTKYTDEDVKNGVVYAYRISSIVNNEESEQTNPIHARPNNGVVFPPDAGGGGGISTLKVKDAFQTGLNFAKKYLDWILIVGGLLLARPILGFLTWLISKIKPQKKPEPKKGRTPLTAEEKEKRSRERRLNTARDDKYELLTRTGRTVERDRWVKEIDYKNKEQRAEIKRIERNERAREQRAATRGNKGERNVVYRGTGERDSHGNRIRREEYVGRGQRNGRN